MEDIELISTNKSYTSGNARITVFTESYEDCCSFEKVTFNITYDDDNWPDDGCLRFLLSDYYHHFYHFLVNTPTFIYDIPDRPLYAVELYYYRLNRKNPLVVGFDSVGKPSVYFSFAELRDSKASSVIGDSFSRSELPGLLVSLNSITNSKLRFLLSEGSNRGVKSLLEFVGYFKVVIYIPDLGYGISEHLMFSGNLFDRRKNFNRIGSAMLSTLSGRDFNSIHVYYTFERTFSLMVEFVDDCRKYQFFRVGESWDFQALDGIETDEQLVSKLSNIFRGIMLKVSRPISHGHVLLDIMDIEDVAVTRVRRFSYRGLHLGIFFGFVFFFSFLLFCFLITHYEFLLPYLRIRI